MKREHSEEALFAFLDARSINELYLHESHPELDSLIYNATVPVILELIKKAEFETWANRMNNADSIYRQAKTMQEKYDQTDNEELNVAFAALLVKMENRVCVNLNNKLFELRKKAENRIKSKKYAEADLFLSEAFNLIKTNPVCELKTVKLETLKKTNQPAFDFYQKQEMADIAYAEGDFTKAIKTYLELKSFYPENKLERFGIEQPELRKFVAQKESLGLTTACVEYFIQQKTYEDAFFFLELLKNLGTSPKETKKLQIAVGRGIAQSNDYISPVENYTNGDKWFRYFKKAYLKY